MTAERILGGLEKVRKTGDNRWVACCPSHQDKSPSLAISETGEGRVLIHCFAGCTAFEVMDALGISVEELFPDKLPRDTYKSTKLSALDALICIEAEARIVYVLAANMAYKGELSIQDKERGQQAAIRIMAALKKCLY